MKCLLSFLAMTIGLGLSSAQVKEFTYTSDRTFTDGRDLYGASFVPAEGKLATAHYPVSIDMGMAQFKFTTTMATITETVKFTPSGRNKAPEQVYKMSIPSINKQSYGYEIILMDFNNADVQGYVKVYVDNTTKHATSLIFRPSPDESERAYYLPKLPADTEKRDGKFFTHTLDISAPSLDGFWGETVTTLYPFASLTDMGDYKEFNRIYPKDRVSFTFEQRIEKIPNSKKEKEVQYICLKKPNAAGEMASEDYAVKKIAELKNKEGQLSGFELDVRDANQNKFPVTINLTPGQSIASVKWGEALYTMRDGKKLAE